jgi:hypothetical protein
MAGDFSVAVIKFQQQQLREGKIYFASQFQVPSYHSREIIAKALTGASRTASVKKQRSQAWWDTFNPSTWETEASRCLLSLKPTCST